MVLPEGLAMPPLPYAIGLLVGVVGVAGLIYLLRPPVTNWTVVALSPWMALGGVLHGLERLGTFPESIEPLFGAPAVYATMAIVTGLTWAFAGVSAEIRTHGSTDRTLGTIGTAVLITLSVFSVYQGINNGTLAPFWPVIAIVVAGVVTAIAWVLLSLGFTESASVTGATGVVVIGAHAVDAVTTAIGYDVIPGISERTPLSRIILQIGDALPTADLIGAGWLFVFVKLFIAGAVVVLFREYVKEEPTQARLVLAFIAAVGLGPGAQNLLVFAIGGL
ncbi:Uncharacterized membrane protein [Natronoarchaeum philippinense]|uniref:Uncharacterized membrane protein n=1 Tax=Natronoarchaeum philippinense TaxID=558529 RepID=A0A285NC65_NATPI|nr:DUF63 family protein [Natronoarchaeum philippinense]SNZ07009.1 Uncharacterized membrane protein [Natronoarchaeum philippinense]